MRKAVLHFPDVKKFAKKYANAIYSQDKYRISLDAPVFEDGDMRLIDNVTRTMWDEAPQ